MTVPEPPITLLASHDGGHSQTVVNRVVIHDEEYPVGDKSAESIASYFHQPTTKYQAHYVVDADSVQHVVPEHRTAAHAPPNQGSIGIEQDGYARFTAADWQTPGSQATIRNAAKLAAEICDRWDVPKVWLSVADLLAGKRGITSHANVSAAWHESTHTDPGPNYPIDQFMALVTGAADTEDDMDPAQFIRNLYEIHLGREPDPAGLNGWVQEYCSRVGTQGQTSVTAASAIDNFFFTCDEAKAFQAGTSGHGISKPALPT